MNSLAIRQISAEQTYALRQKILRPHQAVSEMGFPDDDQEGAFHAGAFLEGVLVGIVSLFHEPEPSTKDLSSWRLRGMAVEEDLRRYKIGTKLVAFLEDYARQKNAKKIWMNARTPYVGFYESLGYQKQGEEFEIADIGPHYVMIKNF